MKFEMDKGGTVDLRALRRLAREDRILIGHFAGVMHPAASRVRYMVSAKTGRKLKKMQRVYSTAEHVDNSELAKWLHNGTSTIPARPYLVQGIRSRVAEIRKALLSHLRAVMAGKDEMQRVGLTAVGAVQEFVRGDYYRSNLPNAASTIRAKGSDQPLIDTGFLVNSITFVRRKGKASPFDTANRTVGV